MSGRAKSSMLRPWGEPSAKTNGDALHFSLSVVDATVERKTNLKRAWFFIGVALLFVFVNQLDHLKDTSHLNLDPFSASGVNLTLFAPERAGDGAGLSVRFRLSNQGNHSVFYPIGKTTKQLIGQVAARTSPSSDWMSLPGASNDREPALEETLDSSFAWIEMPPGGWVDGEFHDAGQSPEEHAYVIYGRPARDANQVRIVSNPYASPRK